MQRKISFMGIVIILFISAGCIEGPSSPLSSLPTILIDHIDDSEETKVFVQGIENTLYGNISIQINNHTVKENFTYSLHITTTLHKFILNVTAWYKLKEYEYTGNITLIENDDDVTLEIMDSRRDDPIERSEPYKIIMERKK